tara:strand:+ start:98 stop:238 length:141 start_codon:yes stop_codon:yes gene_type:complete
MDPLDVAKVEILMPVPPPLEELVVAQVVVVPVEAVEELGTSTEEVI